MWFINICLECDWGYLVELFDKVNGCLLIFFMGKVVGGGLLINVMIWVCGYKNDFDYWVVEIGDDGWNYKSVLDIYKWIEDWYGFVDDSCCGIGGCFFMIEV